MTRMLSSTPVIVPVLAGIKAFHTLAWLSIESCVAYVLWAGFAGRSDRRVAVVAGETLVFAGNGFRCPLTELAERYGAGHGSVTDIYLPKWFAHNMPAIHAPLLMLMACLHARNLMRPQPRLVGQPAGRGRLALAPHRRLRHRRGRARRRAMERGRAYLLAGAAVVAEVAGYLAWRPRMLRWGASRDEAADVLPGDDRALRQRVQSTRAITIEVPPQRVWPWIVRVGIERAGFYSHDWDERLLGRARYVEGRHSATRIHPEPQGLKVGDPVPYGAGVLARVDEIEPCRQLVAGEAFVLRPLPGERTRLIVRYRGMGFISTAAGAIGPGAALRTRLIHLAIRIPGVELTVRAIDFFISDPLHDRGRPHPWLARGDAGWPGRARHQG